MARTIMVKRTAAKVHKPKRFRLKMLLALMEADLPGTETAIMDTCWPLHMGCIHDYSVAAK